MTGGTEWRRSAPTVNLFHLSETGAKEVDNPDVFIADELPSELREVFFTDGDRALTFIEADVATTTKRDRVQRAIKSLLGLGVIESCVKHINQAAKDVNRKIREEARVSIIMEEAGKLPERCDGYREEVIETLADIITLERQHRREGIYIKQKITDKCNTLGRFLSENRTE